MDPYLQPDPYALPLDPMMMPANPGMGMGGAPMPMQDPMLGMPPLNPMLAAGPDFSMMGMAPTMPGPMEMLQPVPPEVEEYVPPGPNPPLWYKEPPKPELAEILEEAENERTVHQDRIAVAMNMCKRLNMEVHGIFKQDKELHKLGAVEEGWLTDLRDEHDAYCSHIAAMDWNVSVPLKDSIDREETIAKEDAIHYFFECFQRQHSRAGYASLKQALPDILGKYGMLAASLVIDPMNDECGLRFQMVDPATVFPIYEGGMGLARVYRVYQATASQVIGSFYDAKGAVAKKVKKIATFNSKYEPHHVGEVVEYWDRAHVMVAFEGKEIFYRKHSYARVPFVIKYGGAGQQGFTQTTHLTDVDGTHIRNFGSSSSDLRREDLMRIAQPFLLRRVKAHDTEEAVLGLMLTAMRMEVYPRWIQQLGLQSHNEGALKVNKVENSVLIARDDDVITPQPPMLTPHTLNTVTTLTQQNKQTGMASGVIMGTVPGAQTTGSAIDILNSAGLEKWRPLVTVIEEFLTELAEYALELIRDWGSVLGMEGNFGVLPVPRRNPNPRTGEAPAHDLTPKILRTHGIRCKVSLRRFNPHNLTQVANGLAIAYNMGILDKRTIIELLGVTDNPDAILDRIDDDELDAVPEVKQEKTLRRLYREADIAERRGDIESARDKMNRAYFIASQMQHRMMFGQPADASGLIPGMPMPNNVPMLNDPALGGGMPGAQGGRPPGGGAPQPMGPGGPAMGG